ncbi:MAG: hypothetical protein ACM3NQ_13710, partial [Bacteroidales bacterium]
MRHPSILLLVFAGLLTAGHPTAAAAPTMLTNGRIRAEFGDRGLLSLTDIASQASYRIDGDDFALAIGGETFDSRSLAPPTRTAAKDKLAYTWTAGRYQVLVAYDLAATWRFLSKQISVVAAPGNAIHVDEVVVFRETLADPIVDAYVPKSARPNLGTGDYGACLRFDKTRGLLVTAQNPFLAFANKAESFSLAYKPDLDWNKADGPVVADRGHQAPVPLTRRRQPHRLVPEWVHAA